MFKKAEKSQRKLKLAIYGASGSGKTYSALAMATGLGKKIAIIDTERSSASLYAKEFDQEFDTCSLDKPNIEGYVKAIKGAQDAGYDVLVIDSLSHGWQQLLEEVEKIAQAKYKGNTWSAWSEGTPSQRKLVDAIIGFDGHVIATMRAKTEWDSEKTNNGKSRPVRIGLAPEQGKGIEYEFDFLMSITPEHFAQFDKSRGKEFSDQIYEKPGKALGEQLLAWLQDGIELATTEQLKEIKRLKDEGVLLPETLKNWLTNNNAAKLSDIPAAKVSGYLDEIKKAQDKLNEVAA